MNWLSLETSDQLENLLNGGENSMFAIFKHSTRCSISSAAKNRMERDWEKFNPGIPVYYLDLLAHRDVSNLVAEKLGIEHQSPQLLILKDGKCVFEATHTAISPAEVAEKF